jgi:protein-disulfide isomerase
LPSALRHPCLAIFVGAAALAFSSWAALATVNILTANASPATVDALTPAETAALAAPQALPDITQGKAEAPATIVEYASMTCSHCAAFHKDVWPALKAKYVETGKAKFVLREFPLDPLAIAAFMLARCAGPEKRDAVVDRLFDRQADWAFAEDPLPRLKAEVQAAGVPEAEIDACLKNQKLLDQVKAVRAVASQKLGVNSTPTFFVSGKRLAGEQSLDSFDRILAPAAK